MTIVDVKIAEIIDGGICVSAEDGNSLYAIIFDAISSDKQVRISFENVTRMTTAFLNTAIGQLYGEFTDEKIKSLMLPPINAQPWHLTRLKLVVERARRYFSDKDKHEALIRDLLDEADNDDI